MAFNEKLADKVRELISVTQKPVEEKKMFSGLTFMVDDKICVSVGKDRLMVRLDPAIYEEVIEKEGCRPMVHSGKIMKGYLFVQEEVLTSKKSLAYWVNLALEFNDMAKSSKKKKGMVL
jgi:TfoX/Sxy family transcriptional regulator of competence genes